MSSSDYLQSVTEFLGNRGWQTSTTSVRDGVCVIAGRKESSDGTTSMLTMVVDSPESQTTTDHLKYFHFGAKGFTLLSNPSLM